MVGTPKRAPRMAYTMLLVEVILVVASLFAAPVAVQARESSSAIEMQAYRGYPDVNPDDWYVVDGWLDYAVDNQLITGYSDTGMFGPNDVISRSQIATILWRIAGEPAASSEPFSDVDYSAWYGDPISWARSAGVIYGYGDTNRFGPDDPVTREQLVTMLARYAAQEGLDTASDCKALDAICGAGQVSSYARESLGWAVDNGIISGSVINGIAQVDPQGSALRSQATKMFGVFHRDVLGLGGDNDAPWLPSGIDLDDDVEIVSEGDYEPTGDRSAEVDADAAERISRGDIVVLEPSDDLPSGNAIKVTDVNVRGEEVSISGVEPQFAEVVDDFDVTGTGTEVLFVEPASGVKLVDSEISTLVDGSGSMAVIDQSFEVLRYGTLTVKSNVSYDFDWGPIKGFDQLDVSVDTNAHFDWKIEASTGKLSHKVASVGVGTPVPGLIIKVDFYVTFSASGEVEVWADAYAVAGVSYVNDSLEPYSDTDFDFGASFDGTATLGVEPDLMLSYLNMGIIDVSADIGGAIGGSLIARSTGLVCCDLNAWMYLTLGVGQYDCLAKDLGLTGTFDVLDEDNSIKWNAHFENWQKVDNCTWGGGDSDDPSGDLPTDDDSPDDSDDAPAEPNFTAVENSFWYKFRLNPQIDNYWTFNIDGIAYFATFAVRKLDDGYHAQMKIMRVGDTIQYRKGLIKFDFLIDPESNSYVLDSLVDGRPQDGNGTEATRYRLDFAFQSGNADEANDYVRITGTRIEGDPDRSPSTIDVSFKLKFYMQNYYRFDWPNIFQPPE